MNCASFNVVSAPRVSPTQIVPVAYADGNGLAAPSPEQVLKFAVDMSSPYLLVDTGDKTAGRLLDWMSTERLGRLIARAHALGVRIALAGSIQREELSSLADLGADVVGVRGAACRAEDRRASIDPDRVAEMVAVLRGSGVR